MKVKAYVSTGYYYNLACKYLGWMDLMIILLCFPVDKSRVALVSGKIDIQLHLGRPEKQILECKVHAKDDAK